MQLRAAAKLHNALFCAMAAPLFARKGAAGADRQPGLARRKTRIVQNGRSLRGSPRGCARVRVRRFGYVLAARLQARTDVIVLA